MNLLTPKEPPLDPPDTWQDECECDCDDCTDSCDGNCACAPSDWMEALGIDTTSDLDHYYLD